MKKKDFILVLFLIIAILVIISYFYNTNKEKELIQEYTKNIKFTDEEQLLAVAYLSDISEVHSKYINNFENIKVYEMPGEEKYLIIPRYNDVKISIYNTKLEENKIKKDTLISKTSMPFIITCNDLENNFNIIIEVEYNKTIFEYLPSLNSEDNTLIKNKYILDITE